LGAAGAAAAQDATTSRIEHADKEPQNWLTFYGNYRGWSYSPLNQITRENVKNIVPVWAFPAGFPTGTAGLRPGLEAAPLVVDGVLYLEGMQNNVYAVEPATGRSVWTYEYKWPEVKTFSIRGARGIAYGDGRIYMGTQDNHVVALDAKTGAEVWNIHVEENSDCQCRITAAPLFVKGKVITGNAGSGYQALRGHVNAYDAKTGALLWHFEVVPAPGEPGAETWAGAEDNYWKTGGGGAWFTGTYDPEMNLLFWGTGDPTPINGTLRPGPNLYTASLLALDVDTGKMKWYFQETPHDLYDYDSAAEPVLVDMDVAGHKRQIIIHPTKNGYTYEYDRETGKFLRAFAYSAPNWNKGIDEHGNPIDPIVPKEQKDNLVCPSNHTGGRGIQHSAYSPHTGLWYSSDFELCTHFVSGSDKGDEVNPNVPPNISAFDPATGKKEWTFNTKYYNMSSLLATAGDLIFGGDLEGSVFALDARTGRKLWSFNTGGRIASAAVSYSVNGRQYIAIGSGGGSETEGRLAKIYPETAAHIAQPASTLFVFALPEK
jgi:alcohol dehydrogenase (cytochrome c)